MSVRHRNGFLSGFRYAVGGLRYAIDTQPNFRTHIAVSIAVVLLGLWLRLSFPSWAVLALTIGGVLATEMLNTAIETTVDLASPDDHVLAKQAKDLAAAAVLLAALTSVIVGLVVLGPPLWARLR
ncbi:MAG: diacylglycerol kinase family protein [Anaerolineae bacterium]|nr:diacylglycerol kinase family protein [Anaerolineae bacterium]